MLARRDALTDLERSRDTDFLSDLRLPLVQRDTLSENAINLQDSKAEAPSW